MTSKPYRAERLFFTLPFLVPLAIFWIMPLLASVGLSLTDWDYISEAIGFVGLENYMGVRLPYVRHRR